MENIDIVEDKMHVLFRVNDDKTVELVDFSAVDAEGDPLERDKIPSDYVRTHQLIALQLTGGGAGDMHAYKHNVGSESALFRYVDHKIEENEKGRLLKIHMLSDHGIYAEYSMQFYKGISAARVWTEIRNDSSEDVGIEYISSFYYGGISKNGEDRYFDKTDIYIPRNSWSNEAQWSRHDVRELGLSHMPIEGYNLPDKSNNRFHYGNVGSWSSCEYLPMGFCKNRETGEISYFQIEHSGSWEIEYGSDISKNLYLALLGPNDESSWWKSLKPGECFKTVPAAFGVCVGDISEAVDELTRYRRAMRRINQDDEKCNIVFNDYMNCLMGDPTEKKEKEIIDKAAELGCEYYCMDCGWYDDGNWWDRVGEWKESGSRFPNGMRSVCDYAHSKGLKMGLWLEIESMGVKCELSQKLPDNWFFCTHGKRRIDNKRYLLDFRNPEVKKYCTETIDRIINDYGVDYFKIDYNVTTGPGSDIASDSLGDAMLEHYRALYGWIREIYDKYPDLVIENCGSGAQRMDYGILELHSLQSTSDQTDYISNANIASNVASAVTPEQAGMWVYPYKDEREHIIWNMVNGLLLRPYISGLIWNISDENFNLMKEGIALYKKIRSDVKEMLPFWPEGFNTVMSEVLTYGLKGKNKAYLAVFMSKKNEAEISLASLPEPKSVKVIYPGNVDCECSIAGNVLKVKASKNKAARLIEIEW